MTGEGVIDKCSASSTSSGGCRRTRGEGRARWANLAPLIVIVAVMAGLVWVFHSTLGGM